MIHPIQNILHLGHLPILNTAVPMYPHLVKAHIQVNTNQIQVMTMVTTVSQGMVVTHEVKSTESARMGCLASVA
mgnify:CR=1 FL=1